MNRPPAWLAALAVVSAVLILNTLLTAGNRWPGIGVVWQAMLSAELAIMVGALAVWTGLRERLRGHSATPAWGGRLLAVAIAVWCVGRYAEVTAPALMGRPINLYWDGQHAWQVLSMFIAGAPPSRLAALAFAAVALPVLIYVAARLLAGLLAFGLREPGVRALTGVIALVISLAWVAGPTAGVNTRKYFVAPVADTAARQARMLSASLSPSRAVATLTPSPAFSGDLSVLDGADVVVVFAEAYGAITLDAPDIAAALAETRSRFARALAQSGRQVVSARMRSPTFGGASWLAHAATLTGVDTRNPDHYALLLTTHRPSLVSHFGAQGYRSIAWMPGLQKPWPEGRFYGFDRLADADRIGYTGLHFGFWRVPDQAALALLHDQELRTPRHQRAPVFAVFPTVSAHAPFRAVPPYVADWSRVTAANAYREEDVAAALSQPIEWARPVANYVQAMRYTFDWLGGYLRELAAADLVLIVIGDHQPIGSVTGPGATWDVPIHVVTTNLVLRERLIAAGFVPGMTPDTHTLGDLHLLTPLLLQAFSQAPTTDSPSVE